MKYKLLLTVIGILIACILYSGLHISDRVHPFSKEEIPTRVDTYKVYKTARIKLRSFSFLTFKGKQISIIVGAGTLVFIGSYSQLLQQEVPLPEPTCNSPSGMQYYIGVTVYDLEKQLAYKWGSDGCEQLDENKINRINLRYSGDEEESITLDIDQI